MDRLIDGLRIQQVLNKVGKYLYKHIDSAYKIQFSGNMCDVYIKVYYQLKYWDRIPGKGKEFNDVHEMPIDINLTTYQNKIRVNIIEADENERTLGHFVFKDSDLLDLKLAKDIVLDAVQTVVVKNYSNYDFLF